jgi:hypothetical protein
MKSYEHVSILGIALGSGSSPNHAPGSSRYQPKISGKIQRNHRGHDIWSSKEALKETSAVHGPMDKGHTNYIYML